MKARYILFLLIIVGLSIKVYPAVSHDFLVNFDSIYHSRIGQIVSDTGWVPYDDPVAGGRPHLYPPAYHLILGYLSILSGVAVLDLIGFVLPFVSSLLVLPTFFLVKKFRDTQTALWASAFLAFNPIVISQSFDSPQIFGFFLLPFITYFFLKGKYLQSSVLFAFCALFNYGVTVTIGALLLVYSLLLYSKGQKKSLTYAVLIIIIGLGIASPWLITSFSRSAECLDVSTAVVGINESGEQYLWQMAPFIILIGFGLSYLARAKVDPYALFWRVAFAMATIGFATSLFIPELHPYDQILLFGFSMSFLLAELKLKKEYKMAITVIMIIAALLAVASVKPPISDDDLAAIDWTMANAEGLVLANLEVSGTINMYSTIKHDSKLQTVFDQFLECIPNKERWIAMHKVLLTSDINEARQGLDKYGIDYIIVGDRDSKHFGFDTDKFEQMGLEVVFTSRGTKVYKNG